MVWRCTNKTTLFSEDGCRLKPCAYARTEKEANSSGEEGAASATPGKAPVSSSTLEKFTSLCSRLESLSPGPRGETAAGSNPSTSSGAGNAVGWGAAPYPARELS